MQRDVIAREFVKIFHERAENRVEAVRAVRSGRVDPRRTARVVHGDGRIFSCPQIVSGERVAGSFALCVALQDVDSFNDGRAQAFLWAEAVRCLFDAAVRAGILARIFASNMKRAYPYDAKAPTDLREFDSVDALLQPENGVNSWPRQKEAVTRAEQWHRSVNATGRRITLLVTMWPEIRSGEANEDPRRYQQAVAEVAEETARWTRGGNFYALGIQLEKTCQHTWGEYQRHGVHHHFRACFPSAARYEVNEPDDLVLAVRALARKMAKLQR